MRTSIGLNIVANYIGTAWAALIQIAFIPVYIRLLGIDAYGLIGVYASLQVVFSILDMGLTPTLNREMARFKAGGHSIEESRSLLRTLEIIYIILAAIIFFSLLAASSWLANHWLHSTSLRASGIARALSLMGVLIALRWLTGLYRGAIMGLQHQVWLSIENVCFSTLRGVGVVLALYFSPTLDTFFIYLSTITLMESFVLFSKTWRLISDKSKPRFDPSSLLRIWRFSAGIALITFLSLLLMQSDKVLLAKLLPLKTFGYYALASSVAGSLSTLIAPISNVAYPRLTELVVLGNAVALRTSYHRFAQILSLVLIPGSVILALFSSNILMLWTRSAAITNATSHLVSLLVIGTMLNGVMNIPYNLQLAHGWTKFTIVVNTIFVAIFIPALYFGVSNFGAIAAGYAWIGLNACSIVFVLPLMHRTLLPGAQQRWYRAVALPAAAALAVAAFCHFVAPLSAFTKPLLSVSVIGASYLGALLAAALACPLGRDLLQKSFRRLAALT